LIKKIKVLFTLLIGNCFLLIALYYFVLRFVFGGLTGFWGTGPFITEAIYFGLLSVLVFVAVWDRLKKLYSKSILLLLLLVPMLLICLVWNADVISGYVVQPYSKSELAKITWNDWDKTSSVDKLKIGQSYYWVYKGREDGLYKGSDYVTRMLYPI
jgi:amino acid permease